MRLHPSVIEKLIYLYETYGGYSDERKLRTALNNLDLTPYERKTTNDQEMILVLTEEYMKALSQQQQ